MQIDTVSKGMSVGTTNIRKTIELFYLYHRQAMASQGYVHPSHGE